IALLDLYVSYKISRQSFVGSVEGSTCAHENSGADDIGRPAGRAAGDVQANASAISFTAATQDLNSSPASKAPAVSTDGNDCGASAIAVTVAAIALTANPPCPNPRLPPLPYQPRPPYRAGAVPSQSHNSVAAVGVAAVALAADRIDSDRAIAA